MEHEDDSVEGVIGPGSMPSIVSTSQCQPYGSDTAEAVARHEQEGKLGPEGCVHEVFPQAQLPAPP